MTIDAEKPEVWIHFHPPKPICDHDFQGWRVLQDGLGGEQFCSKCGLGAMDYTLDLDF